MDKYGEMKIKTFCMVIQLYTYEYYIKISSKDLMVLALKHTISYPISSTEISEIFHYVPIYRSYVTFYMSWHLLHAFACN